MEKGSQPLRCSFCTKSQSEVGRLIRGPAVCICDACIAICRDILAEGQPDSAAGKVFLVHGHDRATSHEIARFLEKARLEVVVLQEQPNAGSTVIEKLYAHSDVSFAVVLLTADDAVGNRLRARQNVLLELGFFLGKLGRRRVTVLHRPGVEIPSDFSGVLFIPLDEAGAWRLLLIRELKIAGLAVDLNAIV
ncbi:MAG TPA: TIR domain-containing protein [Thermoanaerobaculia bacterium]|jgi:predicted nucleotide-binding protein|nr:TIR domain-containing protein [Thermoanaerobaculia bacterium]